MRVIFLGYRGSAKSSSGNTILGKEAFKTGATSVSLRASSEALGRRVTVVEAPGWRFIDEFQETPEVNKDEIIHSVSLCLPGPHAFLLVLRGDISFPKAAKRKVMQQMCLLGDRVWSYTIVVFTYGDWLGDTSIEQHIESEGENLQGVLEKCDNRYHVLNNKDKRNGQVEQLLEKIDEMVARNGGTPFEMENQRLQEMEARRRNVEEKAQNRFVRVRQQRQQLQSLKQQMSLSSNLRVLLLGFKYAGKSTSGNTILGRIEFTPNKRSGVCVKREGFVAGRQITVVDVPGWCRDVDLSSTSQLTQDEICLSVSLCPPGPHAILLVIRQETAFNQKMSVTIKQHLELLGEIVWNHTMVLFTDGDRLGDRSIEQHIEIEGESLQWLIEKCGNRYHVLNNMDKTDNQQVEQLLEKIEEMVAGNGGHHFNMDKKKLQKMQKRRRRQEKNVRYRMKANRLRQHSLSLKLSGELLSQSKLRIVMLGSRGAWKSSAGNTILGREAFNIHGRTSQCVRKEGIVDGRQATIVEAPGWYTTVQMSDTPRLTRAEIVHSVTLCTPGPHAILLAMRLDKRVTEDEVSLLQKHLELLGKRVWSHTMLLFTYGDWLGDTCVEQHIESEGLGLQSLVEKCGDRYQVLNIQGQTESGQVSQLLNKIDKMVAGNGGVHYEMDKKKLEEAERILGTYATRAADREMYASKQKILNAFAFDGISPLSEMAVVLLGRSSSGKSATGNRILGVERFQVGRTSHVCVMRQGEVAGRHVTLVEAPGWHLYNSLKDTPYLIKEQIAFSVSLCPPGPRAFLLTIPLDLSFNERQRQSIQDHVELLGENVWSLTLVLFTLGNHLGDATIEQHIESEGESLQWIINKCGNRYHVFENVRWNDDMQVINLLQKIEDMVHHQSIIHLNRGLLPWTPNKTQNTESRDGDLNEPPLSQSKRQPEQSEKTCLKVEVLPS